jgi:hypothetical protein
MPGFSLYGYTPLHMGRWIGEARIIITFLSTRTHSQHRLDRYVGQISAAV